jgi:hypothetical protein
MSNDAQQIPTLPLGANEQIPQLGFGVFQVPPKERCRRATATSTRPLRTATRAASARRCTPPASIATRYS